MRRKLVMSTMSFWDPANPYSSNSIFDDPSSKSLYVGNLDPAVTEDFVLSLFSQIGSITKCKLVQEPSQDPYAFIEFSTHDAALRAISALNGRVCLGREMKVNWATQPQHQVKADTSKHHHIFVGDLSPEIDNKALREAFATFGEISDCKVIRDLQSQKSKGYGFVSFVNKEDAERSIEQMNGQWLGRRAIRTNWATRKPYQPQQKILTFDEVWSQTGQTNCTVYVGNTSPDITEDELVDAFSRFGQIIETRIFKQQGFCFVRFDNKDNACAAICAMNGQEIDGHPVKCSWGREDNAAGNGISASNGGGIGGGIGAGIGGIGGAGMGGIGGGVFKAAAGTVVPTATAGVDATNVAAQYWAQYYQNPATLYQQWQNVSAAQAAFPQYGFGFGQQ